MHGVISLPGRARVGLADGDRAKDHPNRAPNRNLDRWRLDAAGEPERD